jgi:hypothetical protein
MTQAFYAVNNIGLEIACHSHNNIAFFPSVLAHDGNE